MVDDGKWKVKSKAKRLVDSDGDSGFLDAVVVCSGHVTEPRIAGINLWPGKQIHSHNYRTPDQPFRNRSEAVRATRYRAVLLQSTLLVSDNLRQQSELKRPTIDRIY
ncbi:hypothetical protein DKX38_004436 [Salix brachista]|uniref:Flavin-containing monooxygenase n=1 Tax=Salix brachista TaxID=2182728 RepID=A0A5N5NB62_9ROSI|nr:hypothetical protein DKX38_004436 [Salix brachista]